MRLECQSMQLTIGIIVANGELTVIVLDMHIFWFLKGEFKCLFVFHSNYLGNRIPLEHIIVTLSVQMQDLLNYHAILKVKLVDLHVLVIYHKTTAVGSVGVVVEWYLDDVLSHLKGYIVLCCVLVDNRGYGILAEDDRVTRWGIMVVLCND